MNVYVESSAVLAWLFGEATSDDVVDALTAAAEVVTSELTLLESRRALVRAHTSARITESEAAASRALLAEASAFWHVLRLDGPILERAGRIFPAEPIRTLDALHLASILDVQATLGSLTVVSFDRRPVASAVRRGVRGRIEARRHFRPSATSARLQDSWALSVSPAN